MAAGPNFCSSCGTRIDGAAFCRNCGAAFTQPVAFIQPVQVRQVKRRGLLGRLVLFLLIGFGVLFFVGIVSNSSNSNSSSGSGDGSSSSAASTNPAPPAQPSTPAPTQADLQSADYLDQHYWSSAEAVCETGADDYLRKIAKYDFAWDKTGFLEEKFDSYVRNVKSPGILTLVTDKVKLQNGFGAYEHVTLRCDYDTQTKDSGGFGNASYSIELPPDDQ